MKTCQKNRKGEKYKYRKPEKRAMYSLRWLKNYLKYTPCKLIWTSSTFLWVHSLWGIELSGLGVKVVLGRVGRNTSSYLPWGGSQGFGWLWKFGGCYKVSTACMISLKEFFAHKCYQRLVNISEMFHNLKLIKNSIYSKDIFFIDDLQKCLSRNVSFPKNVSYEKKTPELGFCEIFIRIDLIHPFRGGGIRLTGK